MFGQADLSQHPMDVGIRSEAAVIGALARRGYRVLLPFSFNSRYDLVIDFDGRFVRAQVKTGRLKNGVIRFPTRSVRASMTGVYTRDYDGEIDVFIVYCPENERVYVVPIEEAARSAGMLRVAPAANGQVKGVRWASDYELPG